MESIEERARSAARWIGGARALVVTAGAGMGVDSGLPDFRGNAGFWNAYPLYERLGISFVAVADPVHFARDPEFGWGFYGHRLALYRRSVPHAGFAILRSWIERFDLAAFVVTSNVDGQFQRAGFPAEAIEEIHGSIHYLQCAAGCTRAIWENDEEVPVDLATMRAARVPRCPRCGAVARPNILMFGDGSWIPERSAAQRLRFERFLAEQRAAPLVVVEIGAGTAIPSIRARSEQLGRRAGAPPVRVMRINPREAEIEAPHLSLPTGALAGLSAVDHAIGWGHPPERRRE